MNKLTNEQRQAVESSILIMEDAGFSTVVAGLKSILESQDSRATQIEEILALKAEEKDGQKWVDIWMSVHQVTLPVGAYHRLLKYIGQVATSGRASREWPMIDPQHLQAIMFAYNEGYSKAYDGRVFPNPFAESGSQAAAWVMGTRDGGEQRQKTQELEDTLPELRLCAYALATAVSSYKAATKGMQKIANDMLQLLD